MDGVIDQEWDQDGWILAKFFFVCFRTERDSLKAICTQKTENYANIQASWPKELGQ